MITKTTLQPIDKICLSTITILGVLTLTLSFGTKICNNNNCWLENKPRVKEFSWQNQSVGVEDRGFILTFDRPMDQKSVEKNLVINPPLDGKISWSGRRMAYTLKHPIPYGQSYQIQLSEAKESFRKHSDQEKDIKPFNAEFRSRDRALAYIGTQGKEQGRLIYYNLTQQKKLLLTPPEWVVMDFKFTAQGTKLVFSAAPKEKGITGLGELEIYKINLPLTPEETEAKLTIERLLDNQDYQNHQFDITPDGETLIVQRINRKNPADFDIWKVKEGEKPIKLNVVGGDFLIAPDGETLAVTRGEGISLLPLNGETEGDPLDFLPKFGQLLSFSPDGSAAAMVDFNSNNAQLRYSRSLVYVNNQGLQKELLNTKGSILDCQFTPDGKALYCLLTELLEGESYQELPYFAKIDIETEKVTPLIKLSDFQEVHLSLSPDGLGILFDQILTNDNSNPDNFLTTDGGAAIKTGKLWVLIPPNEVSAQSPPELKELGLLGIRPQWSP
jgi:dipeptidyl aminopeptidase/acylaminoacyl peptidase